MEVREVVIAGPTAAPHDPTTAGQSHGTSAILRMRKRGIIAWEDQEPPITIQATIEVMDSRGLAPLFPSPTKTRKDA